MTTQRPGDNLVQTAVNALASDPEGRAVEFDRHWYTFGDLKSLADRLAELLRFSGAEPHANIAFAPRNRPSAIAALLGLIADRRNVQMLYAYQSGPSLAKQLARLSPSVLIAAAEEFTPEVVGKLGELGAAGIALSDMKVELVAGAETVERKTDRDPDSQPSIEILTSGTTGPARQHPLSYERMEQRFVTANVAYARGMLKDEAPQLVCYPLGNTSGLYSALPNLLLQLPIVLIEKFTVSQWHDYVLRYRPAELFLPPAGMQTVMDMKIPVEDLSCGRILRSGMTNLPRELHKAFEDRYGIPILLSYGATEFGGVVVQMTEELVREWGQEKLGSTGRAIGEAKVRVVDHQTGEVLPPGGEGVLEVLVPSLSPDWQRTTDMAKMDEDDFVFILGRADGAIMRGGFKILPESIEGPLAQHPAIADVGVLGIPDRRLGQVPAALIVLAEGADRPTSEEMDKFLREHVPATYIPQVWRWVDKIPRTSSVKVARAELKRLYEELVSGDARSPARA